MKTKPTKTPAAPRPPKTVDLGAFIVRTPTRAELKRWRANGSNLPHNLDRILTDALRYTEDQQTLNQGTCQFVTAQLLYRLILDGVRAREFLDDLIKRLTAAKKEQNGYLSPNEARALREARNVLAKPHTVYTAEQQKHPKPTPNKHPKPKHRK